MTGTVATYLGDGCPPNLSRFLSGLDTMLSPELRLVLVGANLERASLPDRFAIYDVDRARSSRGVDTLRSAFTDLHRYLDDPTTEPDAVWQITAPHFHAVPTVLVSRLHGVPVATRIPGQKFSEYRSVPGALTSSKTFLLNNVGLRLTRYSDRVVVLSDNNRRNLLQVGVPDERIVVLRPPLDTDQFAPPEPRERQRFRTELGMDHCTAVLYVGRLSKEKGVDSILRVVDEVVGTRPEIRFHLVGDGDLRRSAADHDSVVCHGFVDPDRISRYYKAADALVHPSYTEEEGISWTMLEAAATGLPVFARDIENAETVSSAVFGTENELVALLTSPESWERAPFPTDWALDSLRSEYNRFLTELVTDH